MKLFGFFGALYSDEGSIDQNTMYIHLLCSVFHWEMLQNRCSKWNKMRNFKMVVYERIKDSNTQKKIITKARQTKAIKRT